MVDDLSLVLNNFYEILEKDQTYQFTKKPIVIAHSFGGIVLTKLFEKENINDLISGGIWLSPYPHGNNNNFMKRFLFSQKIIDLFIKFFSGKLKNKIEFNKYLFYDDKIDLELVKNYTIRGEYDSKFSIDMVDLALNMPLKENIVNNNIPKLVIGSYDDILVDNVSIDETSRLLNAKYPVMVK